MGSPCLSRVFLFILSPSHHWFQPFWISKGLCFWYTALNMYLCLCANHLGLMASACSCNFLNLSNVFSDYSRLIFRSKFLSWFFLMLSLFQTAKGKFSLNLFASLKVNFELIFLKFYYIFMSLYTQLKFSFYFMLVDVSPIPLFCVCKPMSDVSLFHKYLTIWIRQQNFTMTIK